MNEMPLPPHLAFKNALLKPTGGARMFGALEVPGSLYGALE